MGHFALVVYGLWFGLALLCVMAFFESIFPGSLADTAFSWFGIASVFLMLVSDSLFSLGSASA